MKLGRHVGRRAIPEANGRGKWTVAVSRPLAVANDPGAAFGKVNDFEFGRANDQLRPLVDREWNAKVVSILRHFAVKLTIGADATILQPRSGRTKTIPFPAA